MNIAFWIPQSVLVQLSIPGGAVNIAKLENLKKRVNAIRSPRRFVMEMTAIAVISLSGSVYAQKSANSLATAALNKKIVTEFYDLAFNQHKPTEAAKKYFGEKYIQHNPQVPNGAAAFYGYFEGFFKEHPKSNVKIYRAIAEGDLVVLHLHSKIDEKDLGRAVVDIFRLENGKIVEHFDVAQAVPAKTPNGNTMFEGSNEN